MATPNTCSRDGCNNSIAPPVKSSHFSLWNDENNTRANGTYCSSVCIAKDVVENLEFFFGKEALAAAQPEANKEITPQGETQNPPDGAFTIGGAQVYTSPTVLTSPNIATLLEEPSPEEDPFGEEEEYHEEDYPEDSEEQFIQPAPDPQLAGNSIFNEEVGAVVEKVLTLSDAGELDLASHSDTVVAELPKLTISKDQIGKGLVMRIAAFQTRFALEAMEHIVKPKLGSTDFTIMPYNQNMTGEAIQPLTQQTAIKNICGLRDSDLDAFEIETKHLNQVISPTNQIVFDMATDSGPKYATMYVMGNFVRLKAGATQFDYYLLSSGDIAELADNDEEYKKLVLSPDDPAPSLEGSIKAADYGTSLVQKVKESEESAILERIEFLAKDVREKVDSFVAVF